MAKSREIPASNSVIESETEESETEQSESEPEPVQPLHNPSVKAAVIESLIESESEPEPEPEQPAVIAKAAANKGTGMKKRSATSPTQETEKKRSKKEEFKRVFSPEDAIVVLQELVKVYPIPVEKESPAMENFYQLIKGEISVDVNKTQVINKIRRLKNKFFNRKEGKDIINVDENGKEKKHKSIVYELSKKIWGNEEGPKSAKIAPKKDFSSSYEKSVDEWVFGKGTEFVAEGARAELETQWMAVRKEEVRLYIEKLELMHKHAKMVHDSMSS